MRKYYKSTRASPYPPPSYVMGNPPPPPPAPATGMGGGAGGEPRRDRGKGGVVEGKWGGREERGKWRRKGQKEERNVKLEGRKRKGKECDGEKQRRAERRE